MAKTSIKSKAKATASAVKLSGQSKDIVKYLMILIFVLALSNVFYFYKYQHLNDQFNGYVTGSSLHTAKIGASVDRPNLTVAVDKVAYDDTGIQEMPAPAGHKYVVVDISIRNKMSSDASFVPALQTYMRDSKGNRYDLSGAPSITKEAIAGTIATGDMASGQLGFTVPKDAVGLKLYIDPVGFSEKGLIVYDI